MATLPNIPGLPNLPAFTGIPNPSNFASVLNSPSVWTGKDGVAGVNALLSNPALQDKIQFGLMKSSFDTLVETGQIKTPGVNLTPPIGQLYDAAANFGKNLISASAGLVRAPEALSKLSTSGLESSLSSLESKLSGLAGKLESAVSGGIDGIGSAVSSIGSSLKGGAAGISASITSAVNALNDPNAPPYTGDDPVIRARLGLPAITQAGADVLGSASAAIASNRGMADLGGLLANSSKFGVGTATAWAKGIESSAGAAGLDVNSVEGVASSLKGLASGFESSVSGLATSSGITGAIGNLKGFSNANAAFAADFAAKAEALKPQLDSLAKQGQFAVNFSDFKLPAAVAGVIPAAGFKGTVDRATLNSAVGKLVGSSKIPAQLFSPQAVDIAALETAALQAKAALNGSIPGGISGFARNSDAFVKSLGDPNAPPYTGDDPIIRQRLGLPPIQTA